jgi:hypothetical protein
MGNNSAQEASGRRGIKVSMLVGGNEIVDTILTNVLHVPRLAKTFPLQQKQLHWVMFLNLEEKGVSP